MKLIDRLTYKAKNVLSFLFSILACLFIAFMFNDAIPPVLTFGVLMLLNATLYYGFKQSNILTALSSCAVIAAAQKPDCTYPNYKGVEPMIYLANKADIASGTFSSNVLTAITMVATKKFYEYEVFRSAVNTIQETVPGKLRANWKYTITTFVLKVDGASKLEIEALNNATVVAIVKNKYQGNAGASAYEVFGWYQGMTASFKRDHTNADADGAYELTLTTVEGFTEPKPAIPLYITSLAATDAVVAALIA